MLSLTVHEHGGLREAERLTFTSVSLPCLSFRRKEESSPSMAGLGRDPQAMAKGQKWLPLPCGGTRRLQTGGKPKQEL